MPKIKIFFHCNICGKRYDSWWSARGCEKRGRENLEEYPQGLMFNHEVGIFALANPHVYDYNKHLVESSFWACRHTPAGDSLDHMCGGTFLNKNWRKYYHLKPSQNGADELKRMTDHLLSEGIHPCWYDSEGETIFYLDTVEYKMRGVFQPL